MKKSTEIKLRKLVERIIREESRKFIPVNLVSKGQSYNAIDASDPNSEPEEVTIISINKDQSGMYNITVKFSNGSTDKWYLDRRDKVFFK